MLGVIDLTEFTDSATDLAVAVGVVGAALVGTYVATKSFGFVTAWVGKLFGASKGKATG
jgi:hypothetical protein